ncbi:MAG: imidazole glycerol phosphate synthase subunit HisF [Eubacteriales bacterium]|nr:imidazole glycerol phosphate synthase subunit HisF [Eubacteriales bacterium]
MMAKRIIPCLDVNKGRVVKGVNFVNLRDTGDPAEIAALYDKSGADELTLLDITATTEGRKTIIDVVRKVAEKISIPLAVGGGISSVEDFRNLLEAGADKVSINSAAVERPELITEAAELFGSQCVVVAIDAKLRADGSGWDTYINGGKTNTGRDTVEWAIEAAEKGAGEILLTSMDRDGTKSGYDIELLKAVSDSVKIPITASGGAGTLEHFYDAIVKGGAEAVLAASLFHFRKIEIEALKEYLFNRGVKVRRSEK